MVRLRVKSRLEKERPERIEPFMKGAQVIFMISILVVLVADVKKNIEVII